jgi:Flp pilus assembly CpaF family ATPase
MRIEYVNVVTGKTGAKELPPKLNPVRIGHHPANHLVLDSPYLGPETGAIDNDVVGGEGWRFWNRNGKPISVGDRVLKRLNEYVPLRESRVAVECWPYSLQLIFTPEEMGTESDAIQTLDLACASLVQQVHKDLVALHPNDSANPANWVSDGYVHRLEEEIAELTGRHPEFPSDALSVTELGKHLAGVAVRSRIIQRLTSRSDQGHEREKLQTEGGWGRPRLVVPQLENDFDELAERVTDSLQLLSYPDLTEQVRALDQDFWADWRIRTRRGELAANQLRYLALRRVIVEVKNIWYGFGPLQDLLEDPTISEIMVNRPDQIFVEKRGTIEASGRKFLTDVVTIIQRIMAKAHRQINTAQPLADAMMADGSRVNAAISPIALKGPSLVIRRFPNQPLTIDELVRRGSLSRPAKQFLEASVINRRNIVVCGGVGTGKTTLLNCLSMFVPNKERIVTIEDTAELQLQKEHVVTLQTRPVNQEGAGIITIRDLVKNALRMRPDRIVVGECRSGEAIDMLQAMNTGHDGSMTTLHANSPEGAIERLVVLVQQNADMDLPVSSILRQIVTAIDLLIQLDTHTDENGRRKFVRSITEVKEFDLETETIRLVKLYDRDGSGPLLSTGHLASFLPNLIQNGLVRDPVDLLREA